MTTCTSGERGAIAGVTKKARDDQRVSSRAFCSVVQPSGGRDRRIRGGCGARFEIAKPLLHGGATRARVRRRRLEVHAIPVERICICLEAVQVELERSDALIVPSELALQARVLARRRTVRTVDDDRCHVVRHRGRISGLCGEERGGDERKAERERKGAEMAMRHERRLQREYGVSSRRSGRWAGMAGGG